MTNDNNTRKKVNAVFFSVIMVLSMAAVGFAAAPAAAQVTSSGTPDDVTVGPDSTTQTITGIDTDDDGDLNISVDALADEGTNLTAVTATETTSPEVTEVDDVSFDSSTNNVTVTFDGGAGAPSAAFDIELSNVNTSAVDGPVTDLQYTVEDGTGDSATTDSFDLVAADDVSIGQIASDDGLSSVSFDIDHSTVGASADEVSLFVADEDLNPVATVPSTGSSGGDSTTITADLSSLEEGDEITEFRGESPRL